MRKRRPLARRLRRCGAQVAVAIAVLMAIGCRSDPRPEGKRYAVGWRSIGSWSGRENTQTETFNVESGEIRIKWQTKNETAPGAGKFKVMVNSGVSGRPIALAVDHRGVGQGTAYVSEEPRLYQLVIESSNVAWTIQAEEGVVGPPEP